MKFCNTEAMFTGWILFYFLVFKMCLRDFSEKLRGRHVAGHECLGSCIFSCLGAKFHLPFQGKLANSHHIASSTGKAYSYLPHMHGYINKVSLLSLLSLSANIRCRSPYVPFPRFRKKRRQMKSFSGCKRPVCSLGVSPRPVGLRILFRHPPGGNGLSYSINS